MNYETKIAKQISVKTGQVTAVINLIDDGNTIPFIARYRKEATGSLDEEQIREISDRLAKLRVLDERRGTILESIANQEKLTPELEATINAATTLTQLEDLYLPYKPKRRTRAMMAREKGLEPLAQFILAQLVSRQTAVQIATPFINEEVSTTEEALAGARDIVAELMSDTPQVRQLLREKTFQFGQIQSEKIKKAVDERTVYKLYYDFTLRIDRVRPHQILALNRGEAEKILRVGIDIAERDWILAIRSQFRPDRRSPLAEQLQLAMEDAAKRLLIPAIERDVRRTLTEQAEAHAIQVFADNMRGLLNQPPLAGHTVMGIDPAYRTGCKVAVVDATGKVLETTAIYPHQPQKRRDEALKTLARLVQTHKISLITIGNGTASRETEQLVAELTRQMADVHYLIVNEAGASVYSASPLAKAELPELDVTIRGAVSIARRAQDPLAELVKIDPKSIGVGLYQHDVNQKQLSDSLDGVVESVVNQVGVNVNTASPALLTHVAGIGPKLAENIVSYREENGRFPNRITLKKVAGLGPKAFEQSAGFLRVPEGDNPLDASAIHPESYKVATAVLKKAKLNPNTPPEGRTAVLDKIPPVTELANQLNVGIPTLTDILEQLVRPGRDPREDLPKPILRSDVLSLSDLKSGMQLKGTVRNVVDFGAFIDIGVKQDGLLHRSQIPRNKTLNVGDVLTVSIQSIDAERGRIGLGWPT
ncbi:MAG: RNA-binding transcriptional accessory protein [Ardenticatenaceae bacterium]|nr:MAG: RNA-binding transcriptional accessory protein [Ardenticatenaceae bacterium]